MTIALFITAICGALASGMTIGVLLGRPSTPPVNKYECGCKHLWGSHQEGKHCLDKINRGGGWKACPCTVFTGERPPEAIIWPYGTSPS